MKDFEKHRIMSEKSTDTTITLVNNLNLDGMTDYDNGILLGLAAETPKLEPHTKESSTPSLHHTLSTRQRPTNNPERIYQGVQTAQISNLLQPLICHPHNGKNSGTISRTGINMMAEI